MKPVAVGVVVAVAVIAAFIGGLSIEAERDGPIEEVGEAIDEATPN